MIKLVWQIFIEHLLNARPVLGSEEHSRGLHGSGCEAQGMCSERAGPCSVILHSRLPSWGPTVSDAGGTWLGVGDDVENSGGSSPPSKGPLPMGF